MVRQRTQSLQFATANPELPRDRQYAACKLRAWPSHFSARECSAIAGRLAHRREFHPADSARRRMVGYFGDLSFSSIVLGAWMQRRITEQDELREGL